MLQVLRSSTVTEFGKYCRLLHGGILVVLCKGLIIVTRPPATLADFLRSQQMSVCKRALEFNPLRDGDKSSIIIGRIARRCA